MEEYVKITISRYEDLQRTNKQWEEKIKTILEQNRKHLDATMTDARKRVRNMEDQLIQLRESKTAIVICNTSGYARSYKVLDVKEDNEQIKCFLEQWKKESSSRRSKPWYKF